MGGGGFVIARTECDQTKLPFGGALARAGGGCFSDRRCARDVAVRKRLRRGFDLRARFSAIAGRR